MGIYDREYYRDETRGSGFFSGVAPACRAIIFINVLVWLAQWLSGGRGGPNVLIDAFAGSSTAIFHGQVWRLLTAAFLHDPHDIFHILWNMLFLWIVGREMEAMYGSREFTLMYLTAAVFSTFCWALIDHFGQGHHIPMVGASGAVMAVVVLYTLYYPRREIIFIILPIQMRWLLMIYLGRDALMFLQEVQAGPDAAGFRTAFAAHLAGAAYGGMYKVFDLRWSRLLGGRFRKPRFRVIAPERDPVSPLSAGSTRPGAPASARHGTPLFPEEQLDARLDEVLAKIAREGRTGLTDEENRILQEASRRARDRRGDRVR